MKEIMVGGQLVTVPQGYIQAEAQFTKDEIDMFNALPSGLKKEELRIIIMEKRVEFYYLYLAGEADIPEEPAPKPKSFWAHLKSAWTRHTW